ncbi:hypothetical protein EI427_25565 (plasmid) [Flammeovirga pectinis]|uniref:Uncharacterized protein n=1 Tax=Flammeovirga pectinis TaxID=2494373 RepID=A0A3Q9FTH1_9BACT|nr:hypothetical protein [Flammeovirga pectinis]AZQ65606.1 hypothetical protein EI427_25565 [Flammeovirga pectinis]
MSIKNQFFFLTLFFFVSISCAKQEDAKPVVKNASIQLEYILPTEDYIVDKNSITYVETDVYKIDDQDNKEWFMSVAFNLNKLDDVVLLDSLFEGQMYFESNIHDLGTQTKYYEVNHQVTLVNNDTVTLTIDFTK